MQVTCGYCGGNWFTLDNLLKYGFSPQAKMSWEKIDDSQWLLKVVVDDKVSVNRTKFNVLFAKTEGVANVSRINVNGEDAGPAVFPNMLAPMRDSVWAKVGAPKDETPKSTKSPSQKAVKTVPGKAKTDDRAKLTEEKKQKDAVTEKLKALAGKYENVQGAEDGTMDVEILGESSIKMSFSKKEGGCTFNNKSVALEYISYGEEHFEGRAVDGDCTIVVNQMGYVADMQKSYLSLDSEGSCSKLCKEPGAFITGRFVKK